MWFLLILSSFVFGSSFGFLLGVQSMLLSAFLTGGFGPWLPYQIFAAGWIGLLAGAIPKVKRFQIPDQLIEQHRYQPLTRQVKERIFGLNAARVFGIDVKAKRNAVPQDILGRLRMSYLEEGPEPSHRVYGWVAG